MATFQAKSVEPENFYHPYTPYGIQTEFMKALYSCIEDGNIGIFESPTGTVITQGKSLSLICGSLTWLRNHKKYMLENQIQTEADGYGDQDEPPWMIEHAIEQIRQAAIDQKLALESRLAKIRAKEKRDRDRYDRGEPHPKKTKANLSESVNDAENDAQFSLEDYESDNNSVPRPPGANDGLSAETLGLMKKLGMDVGNLPEDEIEIEEELKIFYCSRTHSQLSQFAQELRRVKLPSSAVYEPTCSKIPEISPTEEVKYLTLGSRKNLCINPKVAKSGSATAINEKCLDLQQSGTPANQKCAFLPNKENETLVHDFRDHALAKIRDIEELGALGKRLGVCPYYASRPTIKPCEIVALPYPLLLQKSSRDALGISIKGHVVIVDEAHNLMDAITNIHSATISLSQLKRSREQIGIYLQKFRNKLKGKNRVYVTQIVRLIDSFATYLQDKTSVKESSDGLVKSGDLIAGKGVDQINLYKLITYLQTSKLARKVEGYNTFVAQCTEEKTHSKTDQKKSATTPVLTQIQAFLFAITNPSSEGRIFYSKLEKGDICLKYMLLDPTHHFKEIVEEARAVVLAGGTMSPMADYTNHLFPYVSPERVKLHSYGHVIPSANLVAWPVSKGPGGLDFEFTFERRNSDQMLDELGRAIINFSVAIPDGLVVFFPSYSYLELVVLRWQKKESNSESIWTRLSQKKFLFRESKEGESAEETLQEYSRAVDADKGGLLLSVVGGKMSEGINFSDRLGRGVIIVGLPFPNIHSAEWKAKLEYIEQTAYERTAAEAALESTRRAEARAAGREFYENACMRAVNQSIGRAIRHQNDFAAIILLDKRFESDRIWGKLPNWIQRGIAKDAGGKRFPEIMSNLSNFFRNKKMNPRGHVSAGHGRVGKHRKHPGGRGMAGGQHHHRTNIDKYHPGYFGKVGMRYFHKLKNQFWKPTINLEKLWSLVPADKRAKYLDASKKADTAPVLDLLPLGYSKVLGKGRIPAVPIVVRARFFSKEAERKIKEAGGIVELIA
ncbi:MAG: ATP-dependent DNA helicase chl1 [Trizodia sp. TS-e1964]|nr:MAG: ATP-dependent DNA helicase chl1 [Trizodia sp. TS-e1964]